MVKPTHEMKPKKAWKKRNPRIKKLGNLLVLVEVAKPTKIEQKPLRRNKNK